MQYQVSNSHHTPALLALLMIAAVACPHPAGADWLPTPLEVDLDRARSVVIGRITRIVGQPDSPYAGLQYGRATIAVSQVLKSATTPALDVDCAMKVTSAYGSAGIPSVYKVGDSGIWVVDSRGFIGGYHSRLPQARKSDVRKILRQLADRQWSPPVNGLRVWAAVVRPEYHRNPVIIFAVQNASKRDVCVPCDFNPRFLTAVATSAGKRYKYALVKGDPAQESVMCTRLSPGGLAYLRPGDPFIDLKWRQKLPIGRYSVVVTCRNAQTKGTVPGPIATAGFVTAWTGEVSAPAVDLTLAK